MWSKYEFRGTDNASITLAVGWECLNPAFRARVPTLGRGIVRGRLRPGLRGVVCGPELALVLEVDEEVEHAHRGERGEVLIGEVAGELADPAVVGLTAALGEAFELDEAGEVLIPGSRRE